MIQNYSGLKNSISEIIEELGLNHETKASIQKIFSSPHFLILQLRVPGKTIYLYVGRGGGYQGIGIAHENITSELRVRKDKLTEYARSHWKGVIVERIEMSNDDRQIALIGLKKGVPIEIAFFWRGRDMFFYSCEKLEDSWNNFMSWKGNDIFNSWSRFNGFLEFEGFSHPDNQKERRWPSSWLFEYQKNLLLPEKKKIGKKLRKKEKKIRLIKQDLEKVSIWSILVEKIKKFEERDVANESIIINGIQFKFKPGQSFHEKINVCFEKTKKLKKAQGILKKRLEEQECHSEDKTELLVLPKTISPIWNLRKEKITVKKKESINFKLFELNGIQGAIGMNANGNDEVRSKFGAKEDYWFHKESGTSPHLVLKASMNDLSEEVFSLVASLIVHFSRTESTEIDLVYTQVKNLKGVKGEKGKVMLKRQKYRRVEVNSNWESKISLN